MSDGGLDDLFSFRDEQPVEEPEPVVKRRSTGLWVLRNVLLIVAATVVTVAALRAAMISSVPKPKKDSPRGSSRLEPPRTRRPSTRSVASPSSRRPKRCVPLSRGVKRAVARHEKLRGHAIAPDLCLMRRHGCRSGIRQRRCTQPDMCQFVG